MSNEDNLNIPKNITEEEKKEYILNSDMLITDKYFMYKNNRFENFILLYNIAMIKKEKVFYDFIYWIVFSEPDFDDKQYAFFFTDKKLYITKEVYDRLIDKLSKLKRL
jgi:hypothetical protein